MILVHPLIQKEIRQVPKINQKWIKEMGLYKKETPKIVQAMSHPKLEKRGSNVDQNGLNLGLKINLTCPNLVVLFQENARIGSRISALNVGVIRIQVMYAEPTQKKR